jgi:hypothetical protein
MPSEEVATANVTDDVMDDSTETPEESSEDSVEPSQPPEEPERPEASSEAAPSTGAEPESPDMSETTDDGGETADEGERLADAALAAVARQREAFRSALALTLDQVRNELDVRAAREDGTGARAAAELGRFAAGRIDPERFAALTSASASEDDSWLEPARRALETLRAVKARADGLFSARVETGGDLYAEVDRALADAGRAFGAARLFYLARAGKYVATEHDSMLSAFPFRRWSAAERAKAPPLVIEVDGKDLVVGGLAGFLDGTVKLVLVVRGASPPAPLVRLVTPGILVLQTSEAEELEVVGRTAGPAIAALVPEEAGSFLHQPAAGGARVEVRRIPEEEPKRGLGQISAFQQAEELGLLAALAANAADTGSGPGEAAEAGAAGTAGAPGSAPGTGDAPQRPAEPVDKLAAWLLKQADLSDLDG